MIRATNKKTDVSLLLIAGFLLSCILSISAFQQPHHPNIQIISLRNNNNHHIRSLQLFSNNQEEDDCSFNSQLSTLQLPTNRRGILNALATTVAASTGLCQPALAAIDVSGLKSDGGGGSGGSGSLQEQLRAYDGSAATRVNQIKEMAPTKGPPSASPVLQGSSSSNNNDAATDVDDPTIATWAYRAAPGFNPRISRANAVGTISRLEDQVVAPKTAKVSSLSISFEFPADWLQLDKFLGGLSWVDQRNGDRLYVLRTKLPQGETLASVPKTFFGTSIFDPKGTIVKSVGAEIDDYKVASSTILNECPNNLCSTHRRFKIKYATVTGNGLRVERRALVDAYEVSPDGDVLMMMTSSNAVQFEKKDSLQRQTVESIVDSFRVLNV